MASRPFRGPARLALFAIIAAAPAAAPTAAQQRDMTYHTVPPCVFVDTRVAVGAFAAGETRTYKVVGSGSFAAQGGSPAGCGVPGFSAGTAAVQAVAVNVVAVTPAGPGHLLAAAADQPFGSASFLNFNPGQTVANTGPVAVAQSPGGDLKIRVAVSGAHVVASVVGYYEKPVETVWVHPVPGDPLASGVALLDALAGIVDASAAKPYLLQLEPGIYDLDESHLSMKPFVDVAGSGQGATTVRGAGNLDGDFLNGVVVGNDSAEIRDLTVECAASPARPYAIPIYNPGVAPRITDVTVRSSGGAVHWGIRNLSASPTIVGVTADVQGGTTNYGIANTGGSGSRPVLKRIAIHAAAGSAQNYGIYNDQASSPREVRDVEAEASGGNSAYGFYVSVDALGLDFRLTASTFAASGASANNYAVFFSGGDELEVEASQLRASGGAASYGIYSPAAGTSLSVDASQVTAATETVHGFLQVRIGASRLAGGPVSNGTRCAGVYDESYVFFAGPACP